MTLSAYLNVFNVCYQQENTGEIFAIIIDFQFPTNESFKTKVNLDPLNGRYFLSWSSALIHYFNANKDLLIYAPSILVFLSKFKESIPL